MSTVITHITMALLFAIVFGIGMLAPDLDHLTKCSSKNLGNAMFNQDNRAYQKENLLAGGCRGFAHSMPFAIAATALWLGYLIHFIMDGGLI